MNHLQASDKYVLRGKTVFVGPSPFAFDNNSQGMKRFYDEPWLISHPDARKDHAYKCIGVERHCLLKLREGSMIGIMVEDANEAEDNKV